MATKRRVPVSLSSRQVDVTTQLGAVTPKTTTGLPLLDRLLGGGIRTGTMLCLSGPSGIGKTAFALHLAYLAARSKAAVVMVSAGLDERELVARLAARALHREYADMTTTYGEILCGEAWQEESVQAALLEAVETVIKKVGNYFHWYQPELFEKTDSLHRAVSAIWERHERVMLVVDGVEILSAGGSDEEQARIINASLDGRIAMVAAELRRIAEKGCAMIVTVQPRHADLVAPVARVAGELRAVATAPVPVPEQALALGARPLELLINKNQLGPTGIVPLQFMPAATTFEERAP